MIKTKKNILKDKSFETQYLSYLPKLPSVNNSKNVVVIAPAFGLPAHFYHYFSKYLAQKGYLVHVLDYPNTIKRNPKNFKETSIFDWSTSLRNLVLLKANNYPGQMTLIAHSVGAIVAILGQLNNYVDNYIFMNASQPIYHESIIGLTYKKFRSFIMEHDCYPRSMNSLLKYDIPPKVALEYYHWSNPLSFNHILSRINLPKKKIQFYYSSDDKLINNERSEKFFKEVFKDNMIVTHLIPESYNLLEIGHVGTFKMRRYEKIFKQLKLTKELNYETNFIKPFSMYSNSHGRTQDM